MRMLCNMLKIALLAVFGLAMPLAAADRPVAMPADGPAPHVEGPSDRDPARDVPIGSYTLATFWMPQHCKQAIRGIAAVDCARPDIHAMGLALHGLWPDGEGATWPQWCKPAPVLPTAVIAAHYDVTPSAQQLQHEWAKHGTCMAGYSPDRYFDRAGQLYRAIHVPDLRALSHAPQTVGSVKQAIIAANPGLQPSMFKLTLDRDGWLEEIWFCLDTKFVRRACASEQREPADARLLIWRGGRAGGSAHSGYQRYGYGDRSESGASRSRYR